jgi:hypothetical protein
LQRTDLDRYDPTGFRFAEGGGPSWEGVENR